MCTITPVGMQVTVLGSGSAGNCTLVETEATAVLIDAGLSARQINQRLQQIGRALTDVDAVLLTHEHSDHTGALPVLCKNLHLPVQAGSDRVLLRMNRGYTAHQYLHKILLLRQVCPTHSFVEQGPTLIGVGIFRIAGYCG